MKRIARAQVRRPLDRFQRRTPLRLTITRLVGRNRAGAEQFVTQVRFGDAAAVFTPWEANQQAQPTRS
jgi:IS5 family transposase